MDTESQEMVAYYLTGLRTGDALSEPRAERLRPAQLARYADLDELRYDFPLILVDAGCDGPAVVSLSACIDDLMDSEAGGMELADASRLRHHAVRLEREMRRLFTETGESRLSKLWAAAEEALPRRDGDDELEDSLKRLAGARAVDGDVVGCDREMSARLVGHLWGREASRRARRMRHQIDQLTLGLAGILRADDENSPDGTSASKLSSGFSHAFAGDFDFEAMSDVLTESRPATAIPAARRDRVERLLDTLTSQRFFAGDEIDIGRDVTDATRGETYSYEFDSCTAAAEAYQERLPELVSLAKAMRMAELEVDGAYREDVHDLVFDAPGAEELDPSELAQFPDYLVVMNAAEIEPADTAILAEALTARMPLKVLLLIDDLAGPYLEHADRTAPGELARQLAHTAVAIGHVHVIHSAASHLYRVRESLDRCVNQVGPSLMAVFTGTGGHTEHLPPYLVAAAAVESRAFPVFTFEPAAGPDWASRFSVDANPHPEKDWPTHALQFEDDELQRVTVETAFTLAHFLACDARIASRLSRVPSDGWDDRLVAVEDCIESTDDGVPSEFPHIWMSDGDAGVHKLLVGRSLIREARRCRDQWHSLRELGGIRNSFAERLLERERQAWEEQAQLEAEAREAEAASAAVSAVAETPVAEADGDDAEAAPARDPDVTAIETVRCSTCDECTKLNNRMFKYNANKQAYIADLSAGTYAEMVLAAERCQVAIIHPGKPWNPDEPGLEELLVRAEPFR